MASNKRTATRTPVNERMGPGEREAALKKQIKDIKKELRDAEKKITDCHRRACVIKGLPVDERAMLEFERDLLSDDLTNRLEQLEQFELDMDIE